MRKGIILIGLMVILLSSCNNSRIAELEAENIELKATVTRLTQELSEMQRLAEEAKRRAIAAQKAAEEQLMESQKAASKAQK